VAMVRWRNCHHSSVYGQSASRKMVNKWMPNSIYSQKESRIFFLTKRNHFFYWAFWFPARDSSRCSFKFKWVRTCLLSSQKKTVGSSLTSAKQNNYFPPNQKGLFLFSTQRNAPKCHIGRRGCWYDDERAKRVNGWNWITQLAIFLFFF
jgi:hypothetical protein